METMIDFTDILQGIEYVEPVYVAVYDNSTGQVISVGPSHAFVDEKYKVVIDADTAELVINGSIGINSCIVDLHSNTMTVAEIKNVFKIDDVLHRITRAEYSDISDPDVILTYCNSSLTIALSDEYSTRRKIHWDGETVMNFLITDYNDPNILYTMLSLKISDLVGNNVTVHLDEVPAKFSVYTRRLFKNYVIEYK